MHVIGVGVVLVGVWIHPELGVAVKVDGQDRGRVEGQDEVPDVRGFRLGERGGAVVHVRAFG